MPLSLATVFILKKETINNLHMNTMPVLFFPVHAQSMLSLQLSF